MSVIWKWKIFLSLLVLDVFLVEEYGDSLPHSSPPFPSDATLESAPTPDKHRARAKSKINENLEIENFASAVGFTFESERGERTILAGMFSFV